MIMWSVAIKASLSSTLAISNGGWDHLVAILALIWFNISLFNFNKPAGRTVAMSTKGYVH
jgi:hypothetical protein